MAKSPHPLLEIVPLLRDVAGKLARNLSSALSVALRQEIQVRPESLELSSRERFRKSAAEPTCCFTLSWASSPHECEEASERRGGPVQSHASPEQRGKHGTPQACEAGVLEFSAALAQAMLDQLLGPSQASTGAAAAAVRRELTAVDRRVLKAIVGAACDALSDALPPESEVRIRAAGSHGKLPLPAGDPAAARFSLLVALGGRAEPMRISLVRDVLTAAFSQGPPAASAQGSASSAGHAKATATLVASIEEQMDPGDLASLAQGDLLITETHADGDIILRVNGVPKFAGKLGQYHGRRAVTVTRNLE